jgi:hypothetical protein
MPADRGAIMAVGSVEDAVATLARISGNLEGYVGDLSDRGGKAVQRAGDLLGQARSVLSDARHHLALDDTDQPAWAACDGADRLTTGGGRTARVGIGGGSAGADAVFTGLLPEGSQPAEQGGHVDPSTSSVVSNHTRC